MYEIDLEHGDPFSGVAITDSEILDWLGHLQEKRWATEEVMGALLRALDATIGLRHRDPVWNRERTP